MNRVEVPQLVKLLLGQEVQVPFQQDISYVMVQPSVELHMQICLPLLEQLMVLEMDHLHLIYQI